MSVAGGRGTFGSARDDPGSPAVHVELLSPQYPSPTSREAGAVLPSHDAARPCTTMRPDPSPLAFELTACCTSRKRYVRELSIDRMASADEFAPKTILNSGPAVSERLPDDFRRDLYDDWEPGPCPLGLGDLDPEDRFPIKPEDVSLKAAAGFNSLELARARSLERALKAGHASDSSRVGDVLRFYLEVQGAFEVWHLEHGLPLPLPGPPVAGNRGEEYAIATRPFVDEARTATDLHRAAERRVPEAYEAFRKELVRRNFLPTGAKTRGEAYAVLRERIVDFVDFHRRPPAPDG